MQAVESENYLSVVINESLTTRERVMARKILDGEPTSVALVHLFGTGAQRNTVCAGLAPGSIASRGNSA
jgi:hypothetical protein